MKCPTEIAITDRREHELSRLGFISLCHMKHMDRAAFLSLPSLAKLAAYDAYESFEAAADARLSSQLPYIFAVSRFCQYLKCMMRDQIGSFMTPGEAEAFLNRWISGYVLADDDASPSMKAQFPLRDARIEVAETDRPGAFAVVAFLRPHFQLDELTAGLRVAFAVSAGGTSGSNELA